MTMRRIRFATLIGVTAAVILLTTALGAAAEDTHQKKPGLPAAKSDAQRGWVPSEPSYQGKTLSYWLRIIRNRNEEMMPLAFDAIRSFGPDAWAAVPELTRVVTAPFSPIQIGKDSEDRIADKVYDIEIRAEAMDALSFIGEEAAPATIPLIQWALTRRVLPATRANIDDDELFAELVTMDVEQRMRVAGVVAEFGPVVVPMVEKLLRSPEPEKRKLAVAILSADVLPIVADLLRSPDCDDKRLGIVILTDMELVVAKEYLIELKKMLVCDAN
jgi:hypothetical protein